MPELGRRQQPAPDLRRILPPHRRALRPDISTRPPRIGPLAARLVQEAAHAELLRAAASERIDAEDRLDRAAAALEQPRHEAVEEGRRAAGKGGRVVSLEEACSEVVGVHAKSLSAR